MLKIYRSIPFFSFYVFIFCIITAGCSKKEDTPDLKTPAFEISFPEALFTEPLKTANRESSPVIMNRLISLINASVKDSDIHISIFGCDYPAMTTALRQAANRGVNVHLMVDMSVEDTKKENLKVVNELKDNSRIDLVIITNDIRDIAINHNKFALFSQVSTSSGDQKHVVFQTSHNFTVADSRKLQDAVTLQDDNLYKAFKQYWEDMQIRAARGMAFFEYREYRDEMKGMYAFFLPKRKNNQFYGDDTITEILDDIVDPTTCTIRIGMSGWADTRLNIVEKLEDLLDQGAKVEIITKVGIGSAIVSKLADLKNKGAYVQIFDQSKINIHSKYMLIDATWKGKHHRLVVNGSQNFTGNALRYNNEVTMVLQMPTIYEAYLDNFLKIKELPE